MTIYASLARESKAQVLAQFGGKQFSEFKPKLAALAIEMVAPMNTKMRYLLADTGEIDRILRAGAVKAREVAAPVMAEVRDIMGFWK